MRLLTFLVVSLAVPASAQETIRLNQIGFYPGAPKLAIVVSAEPTRFEVRTPGGSTAFEAALSGPEYYALSDETVRVADFSEFRTPGEYVLHVPGLGDSHVFSIGDEIHAGLAVGALKAYYFQRASTALDPEFAGQWARPAGHPDTEVLIHPSAAGPGRPAGSTISAPRGWYDAGDLNKYVVNSGISTWTLLALQEHYPAYAGSLTAHIPESGNDLPDLLDEALWNLRWILTMQDPHDGGVYHKLTTADFAGYIMPHEGTEPRYVVQKGTGAALNLAAVMAQASRVYQPYRPELADSMLTASLAAWRWALANPDVSYNQWAMNREYDPDVVTGAYGDGRFDDEFAWAAAELAQTTRADSFLTRANPANERPGVPTWNSVGTLGWLTRLAAGDPALEGEFLQFADTLAGRRHGIAYRTTMGADRREYNWGSSSNAANQGVLLIQAYRLTGNEDYLWAAVSNLDYLLGRNATGYSFVTGFGDRTPMHIHHRQSEADGLPDPVPGLLSGGPNPGQQDRCEYPSDLPAKSFVDHVCSYASNEVTINWNAPLLYLTAAIEAEMQARREQ